MKAFISPMDEGRSDERLKRVAGRCEATACVRFSTFGWAQAMSLRGAPLKARRVVGCMAIGNLGGNASFSSRLKGGEALSLSQGG
jgi:hypothetical protein